MRQKLRLVTEDRDKCSTTEYTIIPYYNFSISVKYILFVPNSNNGLTTNAKPLTPFIRGFSTEKAKLRQHRVGNQRVHYHSLLQL